MYQPPEVHAAILKKMSFFPKEWNMAEGLAMAEWLADGKLSARKLCNNSEIINRHLKEIRDAERHLGGVSEWQVKENVKQRNEKRVAQEKHKREAGIELETITDHFERLVNDRKSLLDDLILLRHDYEYALFRLCEKMEDAFLAMSNPDDESESKFGLHFISQRSSAEGAAQQREQPISNAHSTEA